MVNQYLETALWSSTQDDDTSFDENFSTDDFSKESLKKAEDDCNKFIEVIEEKGVDPDEYDDTDLGYDLWLTRNGHGAGFWDGDYPEPDATILTEAANSLGEQHVIEGDDGKLYLE